MSKQQTTPEEALKVLLETGVITKKGYNELIAPLNTNNIDTKLREKALKKEPLRKIKKSVPKEDHCSKYIELNGKEFCFKNRQDLSKKINVPVKDIATYFNEGQSRFVKIGDNVFIIDIKDDNSDLFFDDITGNKIRVSNKNLINGVISNKIVIQKLNSPLVKKLIQDYGNLKTINPYYVRNPKDFWGKKSMTQFNLLRIALKENREIDEGKNLIIQNPPEKFDLNLQARKFFQRDRKPISPYFEFFNDNDNYLVYLQLLQQKIYSTKSIKRAYVQLIYYSFDPYGFSHTPTSVDYNKTLDEIGFVLHTTPALDFFKKTNPLSLKFVFSGKASGFMKLVIGYRLIYTTHFDLNLPTSDIKLLKAFQDCNDRKFLEYTCGSSKGSGICIYETFLDIMGIRPLRYKHNTDSNNEKITKILEKEGKIISDAVKNGDLYKSLELLTKKYECEIILIYYGTLMYNNKGEMGQMCITDKPTITKNGETMEIVDIDFLNQYDGKKIMLYQKNTHVAPSIFKLKKENNTSVICSIKGISRLENMRDQVKYKYFLEPDIIKEKKFEKKIDITNILGYDFETFTRPEDNVAIPFSCCITGSIDGKSVNKSFYGIGCEKEVAKFIAKNSIKWSYDSELGKMAPSKFQTPIYIYGFNNRNFDNLLIWEALHNINPSMNQIISGNSIKYIGFNRIKILDISAYYSLGPLRSTAKSFNLEKEKGVYPYKFPNADNLNYVGTVPDKKYWNGKDYYEYLKCNIKNFDESDYKNGIYDDEFLKKNIIFDLKKYTLKYCMLDSELVLEMGHIHLGNCKGVIYKHKTFPDGSVSKDKKFHYYDVSSCVTSAGIAVKMFQQCFLSGDLYQSPDDIVVCEGLAYKGGRTEVFKTYFKPTKKYPHLFYIDINSSYPASMTKEMPVNYIDTIEHNDFKVTKSDLVSTNLYLSSIFYKGSNKNFIPNIVTRDPKTKCIIPCKDSYRSYNWGCELLEALENDCEVIIHKEMRYEKSFLFKDFIDYFYAQRLLEKKTNPCKAQFTKTVMNSLYGKFGQRCFDTTMIFNTMDQLFAYADSDWKILKDFQICREKIIAEFSIFAQEYRSIGKLMRFSSYIAALSRCKLSEVIRDIGTEHIYYCDTDSIFTTKMPSASYISQDVLGLWKLEGRPIKKAIFIAPKMYYYDEVDLNNDEIEDIKEDFEYNEDENSEENEKRLLKILESQVHSCKKAKGIKGEKLNESDYDDLHNETIKEKAQENTMFIRSFNNVKIIEMVRRVKPVLNKREWNGNDSEAFQNIEAWRSKILEFDNN